MLHKIFKSPWTGALGVLVSALWEAFWLVGPPIGLGPSEHRVFLLWGLAALLISATQAFFRLYNENQTLKDRPYTFEAKIYATPQTSAEGMPIKIHRIAITNTSKDHAECCELTLTSLPVEVPGLTRDTALEVKDSVRERSITDITRGSTKHFDLFMTYLEPHVSATNRPRETIVLAPNYPTFVDDGKKQWGDAVLSLGGKKFNAQKWALRVIVDKGIVDVGSIIPRQP
jgi:hypothetical protein